MSGSGIRKPAPPRPARSYYEERRRRRERRLGHDGWPIRVEQIADRDHLYHCYQELRREGGHAPGGDGFTYDDFTQSEVGDMLGALSRMLRDGSYCPQRVRTVPIPKPGTDEYRKLKIGTLLDRVAGKAVDDAFKKFWEARFLPRSYGFRPKRGAWRMLADLEVAVRKTGHRSLAVEDVRNAFDNLPIDQVVECHRRALELVRQKHFTAADKARTLDLVATVLRGHDTHRQRGIDQGAPYSPCALNVLLHYRHDVPLNELPSSLPWYRYADNLAYLVKGMSEGRQVLAEVAEFLRPLGLCLKGKEDDGVRDLHGDGQTQLLGFTLTWNGEGFDLSPGKSSLDHLRQHLGAAHVTPNPPAAARKALLGWVEAMGPAFENGDVAEVLDIAAGCGFRELPSRKFVATRWKGSRERWQACRKRAERRHRGAG